jgi:hypothetical protein
MSTTPDYAALVKLLPTLRCLVDGCGEVTLIADEAALIRSLGFDAHAGRWRVPPVTPELVRDNPLLENLSIGWESALDATQRRVIIKRRREITSTMVTEVAQKILCEVENAGGQIQIRKLQPKFWKFPRLAFHKGLGSLMGRHFVRLEGKKVVVSGTRTGSLFPRILDSSKSCTRA